MDIKFSKEDIKNSLEYQWRKISLKWVVGLWAATAILIFFGTLIISLDDIQHIGMTIKICLIVIAVYSLIYLPFVMYYIYKMIYFLKYYEEFNFYEVMLDDVSTSWAYRGAVYYTVTINDDGMIRKVTTNPYFSSGLFAKFPVEDFNNKKVIGLYDKLMDKFYIIKKI